MRVESTFSGIGGLDLGLERAGMRVAFQAESDEWCRRVLAYRFPGVECYADVRDVAQGAEGARPGRLRALGASNGSGDALNARPGPAGIDADLGRADGVRLAAGESARRPASGGRAHAHGGLAGRVDVLCGGFPCQDVSVAGRRAGLAGERSGLFYEFVRIADALRPAWVLIENVPGLLSSNDGRDFGVVVGTLAELGYGVAWRVLDSRYFGVPQRRRRVFVVGRLGGDYASALRALCESCEGSPQASECSWQGAPTDARGRVARSLTAHHRRDDGDTEDFVTSHEIAPTLDRGAAHGPRRNQDAPMVANALDRMAGGPDDNSAQANHLVASFSVVPESGQGTDLRASPIDQSNALDATSSARKTDRGVRIASSAGVRRLTPRECERLQSFPDDWTLVPGVRCPDSRRYAALGNAVTVNVAEWIGRRIMTLDALGA